MVTSRLTLLPELWSVSLFMIFHYHLRIGEVRTIRNETTYPIHGKYLLNLNNTKKRMHQNFDTPSCFIRQQSEFTLSRKVLSSTRQPAHVSLLRSWWHCWPSLRWGI